VGVRFMPDGRLKTESGSMLDRGANLTSEDALIALSDDTRVLLNSYPHTDDITADPKRVRRLLSQVTRDPDLEGHSASLYKNATERVLVIEHHH
jgi:hypothetical protein